MLHCSNNFTPSKIIKIPTTTKNTPELTQLDKHASNKTGSGRKETVLRGCTEAVSFKGGIRLPGYKNTDITADTDEKDSGKASEKILKAIEMKVYNCHGYLCNSALHLVASVRLMLVLPCSVLLFSRYL